MQEPGHHLLVTERKANFPIVLRDSDTGSNVPIRDHKKPMTFSNYNRWSVCGSCVWASTAKIPTGARDITD